MPGPDPFVMCGSLFGYGPAPGMELIPYFLAMLAWAGLAVLSILFSPITKLVRRLRGRPTVPEPAPTMAPAAPSVPETPVEGTPNGV